MRNLWNRIGQLVSGFRRRSERLPMAVDSLYAGNHYVGPDWDDSGSDADDVLRLLHRYSEAASSRPRPGYGESVGLGPLARSVPGGSLASVTFDPYQQEPAGYSHVTLGGWTLTRSIDCE